MVTIIEEHVDEFPRDTLSNAALERAIPSSHDSRTFRDLNTSRLGRRGRREAARDGLATDRRGNHVTLGLRNFSLETPRLRHFAGRLALPNRYGSIILGHNQLEI